jgi:hypothetical protein
VSLDPSRADRLVKLLDAVRVSETPWTLDAIIGRIHHHVLDDLANETITRSDLEDDLAALTKAELLRHYPATPGRMSGCLADRWAFRAGPAPRDMGPQPWLRALVERVDTGEV